VEARGIVKIGLTALTDEAFQLRRRGVLEIRNFGRDHSFSLDIRSPFHCEALCS
jgi:hypothetical protein